jgi:predicted amidohydrolase
MRPDPDKPVQEPPVHVAQAQAMARALGCFIVQANWPNALNRPEESVDNGHSAVISPDGELMFRLPRAEPGIGPFELGASDYEWLAA